MIVLNELFIQKIKIDWERISKQSYLRYIDSLCQLDELKLEKNVTFFVGENGSGKSTLLEAIAIASGFNAEGGTRNYYFSTYETHSELCQAMTIVKGWRKISWGYFLRAESFYNVATKEMEYADSRHPSKKYHEKSHGESFLALVQNNFKPNGLYLLDEPEAALSPQRQLTLLVEMNKLSKLGAQFIVVTHSPILLGLPDAQIYSFDHYVHEIEYEETDSYQITEMFINNRNQLLEKLFDEDEI
uniref:AAA family ATPase n=1 Tax=Longibaculum muris TaxID=1796628 RepID=UPI0022E29107|nr:AAA family ATPase [Longibaculum muris]